MTWPIEKDATYGCWLWTGRRDRDGYALTPDGKRAHRVVYAAEVGPIEPGLDLDHTCRRRRCVAPLHLEPVTQSKNEHRKRWRSRVRIAQCRGGHDLSLHGIVTPEGGRVCRECAKGAM